MVTSPSDNSTSTWFSVQHVVVIEQTFGLLKGRFRRLKYLDMLDIKLAAEVVAAACWQHRRWQGRRCGPQRPQQCWHSRGAESQELSTRTTECQPLVSETEQVQHLVVANESQDPAAEPQGPVVVTIFLTSGKCSAFANGIGV